MPSSYTNLLYHIIFSTHERRPWLIPAFADRVHAFLGGLIRGQGGIALEINGMPDHLHIVAKLRPDRSMSDAMRDLKADSSKWIHRTFPELKDFAWQGGYGAFTVSPSQLEDVRRYVRDQKVHHRKMTFQEEFLLFLKQHGVEYDERYIWK